MIRVAWFLFCQLLARWLGVILFRYRAFGYRNVPARGGAILASNHQSFLDPPLVGLPLPRSLSYMARASLFRFLPFRILIESLGAFPIERGTADLGALRTALRRLKDGNVLLVFPEGTRTRDGSLGAMRGGIGILASRARVPVIPVLIRGAHDVWPRERKLPRPGWVEVHFGEPIPNEIAWDADRVGPELERVMGEMKRRAEREGAVAIEPPALPETAV